QGSADIKLGAQLIVRETQSAVFYRDGKACDSFGPGRHTLATFNLPIITKLFSAPWAFESIFKAEVYFINHKTFVNLKWGTREPVAFRDKELGLVRLRAFGAYSFRVAEPMLFINQLVGRQARYTTAQIEDYLREIAVSRLNDLFGEKLETIFNLPARYEELASLLKERLQKEYGRYGIQLLDFYITSITPPEEVQKMIDERGGMAAVKDLDQFLKFKLAKSLDAPGGTAQEGAGMGVGMGVGMILPGYLSKAFVPDQQDLEKTGVKTVQCPECLSHTPENSRFCFKCGHQMSPMNSCPSCGKVLPVHAKFCMECGHDLAEKTACKKCGAHLPPGTKFCTECGEKAQ
ncbi:MAG: SPFH domain-containing protein, partial [Nitrospinae bacterium]|nr:SPFH domain-containing protein [Nitrospinota bacterium]